MRKLIWCLTTLMVVGTAAVYLTANYLGNLPETTEGKYSRVAKFLAGNCNPVAILHSLIQAPAPPPPAPPRQLVQADPIACPEEPPAIVVEPPPFLIEVEQTIESIEVSPLPPQAEMIQVNGSESNPASSPGPFAESDQGGPCPFVASVEGEGVPAYMPDADEGVTQDNNPAVAPLPAIQQVGFHFELPCSGGLCALGSKGCEIPSSAKKMPLAWEDACETGCEEAAEEPGDDIEIISEQSCPEFVDLEDDADDCEPCVDPSMCPTGDEGPASEEEASINQLESSQPALTAPCREDPNYHHNYPGCPYMVPLPSPVQRPGQPGSHAESAPRKNSLLENPCHAVGVDTMECRPDDVEDFGGSTEPF